MKYKYSLSEAYRFSWPGITGFAFNSKSDFERASAAVFEVNERHGRVRNLLSDRVYLVLEGAGEFVIDSNIISVSKYDVVIVPKDTEYDYRGKMKLFLVHCPAYDPTSDIDLENMQSGNTGSDGER